MKQLFFCLTVMLFFAPLIAPGTPGAYASDGDSEIRIGIADSNLDLNPLYAFVVSEAQLLTGIHEGLVSYHPLTLEPVPGIAADWSTNDDESVYEFTLREDARYSNGDRVTAEHVRDTWFALLDLGDDAPYAGLFDIIEGAREYRRGSSSDRDSVGIRAPSSDVFEVELSRPAGHFTQMIAHHSFGVLHPDMLENRDHTDPESHIGNGPFVLTEFSDERLVMEQNSEYWASDRVRSERIVYERIGDPETATERYLDGELHWNAGSIAYDLVAGDRDLVVNSMFATTFYFIRAEREPWSNADVRRAMALLLPWDEIRSEDAYFRPTHTLVPEMAGYPQVTGISEQDRETALELLQEAGYPEGEGLPDPHIRIPGGEDSRRVSSIMAEAWSTIGLEAEIETVPYPEYFDVVNEPEVTVAVFSWIGDYSDPLTFLQLWSSDSNLNQADFEDSRYDQLIDDAIPLDGTERYEKMAEAEQLLLETGTIMPVTHSAAINLVNLDTLEGWFPNALDIHPPRYLQRTPGEPAPGLIRY
ncbi:MAG: peptide ABC transporter substrate-binding protein [Spirochaetota bacterium]